MKASTSWRPPRRSAVGPQLERAGAGGSASPGLSQGRQAHGQAGEQYTRAERLRTDAAAAAGPVVGAAAAGPAVGAAAAGPAVVAAAAGPAVGAAAVGPAVVAAAAGPAVGAAAAGPAVVVAKGGRALPADAGVQQQRGAGQNSEDKRCEAAAESLGGQPPLQWHSTEPLNTPVGRLERRNPLHL